MMNQVVIKNISEFSIEQIADSGQAFRWEKIKENHYLWIAHGKLIDVEQVNDDIHIKGINSHEYDETWKNYFDLERDYQALLKLFASKDEHLKAATSYGQGVRILNQDLWEMIITFIISGNNNIPRIKSAIEKISATYGELIEMRDGKSYYAFPSPHALSQASIEDLRALGLGYRDKYIYKTTQLILEGEVDLSSISSLETDKAREALKMLPGIGNKVADCILLFACGKTDVFPVDTWVKKILEQYYHVEKTTPKAVYEFAHSYFGQDCGIAQQYLFYYIRNAK